jgi:hypothetical protein
MNKHGMIIYLDLDDFRRNYRNHESVGLVRGQWGFSFIRADVFGFEREQVPDMPEEIDLTGAYVFSLFGRLDAAGEMEEIESQHMIIPAPFMDAVINNIEHDADFTALELVKNEAHSD